MSDVEKMKEVEDRIDSLLKDLRASKLTKSKIVKYYQGLDMTYDEFLERAEHSIIENLNEEGSTKMEKILGEF